MAHLLFPRRFSIRSLLATTFLVAVALAWYVNVERPRLRLISEIELAGGRIKYHTWSVSRPFKGSRLYFVSLPQSKATQLDLEELMSFPRFEQFGLNDSSIRRPNGTVLVCSSVSCNREQFPLFIDTLFGIGSSTRDSQPNEAR
jgi:hypothetical protein